MGPHFFKCGKLDGAVQAPAKSKASMGPHFFKCGKVGSPERSRPQKPGFNGAALFQVRKGVDNYVHNYRKSAASMGPHFFKCGKLRLGCLTG